MVSVGSGLVSDQAETTHNGDAVIVDVSLLVELLLKLGVLAVGPGRVWC